MDVAISSVNPRVVAVHPAVRAEPGHEHPYRVRLHAVGQRDQPGLAGRIDPLPGRKFRSGCAEVLDDPGRR